MALPSWWAHSTWGGCLHFACAAAPLAEAPVEPMAPVLLAGQPKPRRHVAPFNILASHKPNPEIGGGIPKRWEQRYPWLQNSLFVVLVLGTCLLGAQE